MEDPISIKGISNTSTPKSGKRFVYEIPMIRSIISQRLHFKLKISSKYLVMLIKICRRGVILFIQRKRKKNGLRGDKLWEFVGFDYSETFSFVEAEAAEGL